MKKIELLLFLCLQVTYLQAAHLYLETESFKNKGGWVVDQQFMDEMGSPYLLAHGMGMAVKDASDIVNLPEKGIYYIYARTYNWTSPWHEGEGPGAFQIKVNGKKLPNILGKQGNAWQWELAGKININQKDITIALHDLTGFEGRCDAIWFTSEKNDIPPSDKKSLIDFQIDSTKKIADRFDLVVCGAGIAGISAAVTAARLGLKVALIGDRPIVGGNNSSEVRVHMGGRINIGEYPHLGDLQKEFCPTIGGNAQPAEYYEDDKKMNFIKTEKNITLFLNNRIIKSITTNNKIISVISQHIENGEKIEIKGHFFADCTGDGTVGFLSGADYRMGRESKAEFQEQRAPDEADSITLGSSVQWYSTLNDRPTEFPEFSYGITFNNENCQICDKGEWTWETGMNIDNTHHFEQIRDYGFLVIYSNWSYLKNHLKNNKDFHNRSLGWVAYIAGKRESRRLLGDYILKMNDITHYALQEDGTASTTWPMDLHFPDSINAKQFPTGAFKSININTDIHPYPIPYRCLYSRNINNLFMAGRCISVSHIVHGSIRVMRTTGMMGEVVGMAATVCNKHGIKPREIYQHYFHELKSLMKKGVGKPGAHENQHYNEGSTLPKQPHL